MGTTEQHIDENIPDQAAVAQLFKACFSRLCLFVNTMVNDRQSAEDIVQECFVKLWQHRAKISWSRDMLPYLYTSCRNAAYNYLRDRARLSEIVDDIEDHEHFTRAVIESETMYEIHCAIRRLPPQCGHIFKAIFLEGKKTKQVSQELNISESTIRSHKAAALLFLRRVISPLALFFTFFSR